jgi:OOP family OmpA-OmpF porin
MRLRSVSLAIALLLATTLAANAQPFQGLYVGAGAGFNLPMSVDVRSHAPVTPRTTLYPQGGVVGLASVGYGLGNGIRFELEGNFRQANVSRVTSAIPQTVSGRLQTYGVMANVMFDMDVGSPWIYPYLGAGAGYAWSHADSLTLMPTSGAFTDTARGTQGNFAFQGIAGLSFPMPGIPGLSLAAEYRFFGVLGNETFSATLNPGAIPFSLTLRNQYNHSFLFGVRYAFNVAAPTPAAPAAQAAPAPAPARSYLVFFDWDKTTLTDRARQIIKEAADNSTRVQYTRIEVNGYADTSGTHQYNHGLSLRRAGAVQAELVRDGVPQNAIAIQGFGDTNLLVPTGPGVREPQNRRVEIVIR